MKKNKNSHVLLSAVIFVVAFFVAAPFFFASAQTQINVAGGVPGPNEGTGASGPGAIIANFYEFALLAGGVLAFAVVVYGGVKYMAAAGNPSGQSDAKEWIEGALLGLLLLVGSYFVLKVINPDLLNLTLPTLDQANITGTAGGNGGGTGVPTGNGCAGTACVSLRDQGLTCKPASAQPGGIDSCSAAQGMINTLKCIQSKDPNFIVSEAVPPTVSHSSRCHNTGCCVDTNLTNPTCAEAQALVSAAQACGAAAVSEYAGCAGSKIFPTTTGGNVHINSAPGGGC